MIGVGHRRVGDDGGLKVIGVYPRGQSHYNMKEKGRRVPKVALPSADPFYGGDGPLIRAGQPAAGESVPTSRGRRDTSGRRGKARTSEHSTRPNHDEGTETAGQWTLTVKRNGRSSRKA